MGLEGAGLDRLLAPFRASHSRLVRAGVDSCAPVSIRHFVATGRLQAEREGHTLWKIAEDVDSHRLARQSQRRPQKDRHMSNRGQGSCIAPKVRCRGIANQTCLLAFVASAVVWLTCLSQTATAMTIYILDSTYTSLTLEVEPSDSIDNVKQKTQDFTGIDPASQYLYFGGTLLEEGYTLSEYSIGRGSTLPLVATAAFSSTPLPNLVWNFGVNDMTAGAGVGWTLWQTNDPVDLSSYGPGAITFNVFGYNGLLAGTPSGYDSASPYSLTFLTAAGGISGFSASQFDVMGTFADKASIVQSGNSLLLQIGASAVPEIDPNSLGSVLALVLGSLGQLERRRLKVGLAA